MEFLRKAHENEKRALEFKCECLAQAVGDANNSSVATTTAVFEERERDLKAWHEYEMRSLKQDLDGGEGKGKQSDEEQQPEMPTEPKATTRSQTETPPIHEKETVSPLVTGRITTLPSPQEASRASQIQPVPQPPQESLETSRTQSLLPSDNHPGRRKRRTDS